MNRLEDPLKTLIQFCIPKGFVIQFNALQEPKTLDFTLTVDDSLSETYKRIDTDNIELEDGTILEAKIIRTILVGVIRYFLSIKNFRNINDKGKQDAITFIQQELVALDNIIIYEEIENSDKFNRNNIGINYIPVILSGTLFSEEFPYGINLFTGLDLSLTEDAIKALQNSLFARTIVFYTKILMSNAAELSGVEDKEIFVGTSFDKLEGIKAFDLIDGDITKKITILGEVNVNVANSYALEYSVINSRGVITTKKRTVLVKYLPKIFIGSRESFVILENGDLYAWGANYYGQLTIDKSESRINTPRKIMSNINHVSSSYSTTYIINNKKELCTVGSNEYGQLGNSNRNDSNHIIKIASQVDSSEINRFVGYYKYDGELFLWGNNFYGSVGINSKEENITTPQEILLSVNKIKLSWIWSIAITMDKKLYQWGNYNISPVYLGDNFIDFQLGNTHNMYIKESGELYAFGHNNYGQCGLNPTNVSFISDILKVAENIKKVAVGTMHTLVLSNDGKVYSFGYNGGGQLGNGNNNDSFIMQEVLSDVKEIYANINNSFAIKNDGTLYGWGVNAMGQLGNSTTMNSSTPIKILEKVISFKNNGDHSLAVTEDGSVWSWGFNKYGQIGNGTFEDQLTLYKLSFN